MYLKIEFEVLLDTHVDFWISGRQVKIETWCLVL